jgi:SAM-dependent methyltransferase
LTVCSICGGTEFKNQSVLWQRLIEEWQLSPCEVEYIDRQQGRCCTSCGANLRSVALANALRFAFGTDLLLSQFAESSAASLSVLEINDACHVGPTLKKFPKHVFAAYPEVDIHRLPYPDNSLDVVVHSDTLEHVEYPIHALTECRRVLKPSGWLCFTIPIIVGRLTRDRAGLPLSFHGSAETSSADFSVKTEFGADAWTYLIQAGFSNIAISAVEYPAGIALSARK